MRLALRLPVLGALCTGAWPVSEPEDWVSTVAGNGGEAAGMHHSRGNTLPLVGRPWGFNHWAPQSVGEPTSWWLDADSDTFRGVRCTHQPSPWIGDYGWFLLRPFLGATGDDWLGFTTYRAEGALRPYALDLTAGPFGVRVQLAVAEHAAVLRVTFPASVPANKRRVCALVPRGNVKEDADEKRAKATGTPTGECHASGAGGIDVVSRKFADGVPEGADFALRARLEASGLETEELPETDWCVDRNIVYKKRDGQLNMNGQKSSVALHAGACMERCAQVKGCSHFSWKPVDSLCHVLDDSVRIEKVRGAVSGPPRCAALSGSRECCFLLGEQTQADIRIGTSFISASQSVRALDREVGGRTLEQVAAEGKLEWQELLLRVEVRDAGPNTLATSNRVQLFYTCLYRSLLFPRRLREFTPEGVQHWSPYSGKVVSGHGVTDNGFWDTFRTVYPLLALAYPRELGELLDGWLSAFRHGGWLPKWASPGYRGSMVGTFADVVLADAVLKNIEGFDREEAWRAIYRDAYEESGPKDLSRGKVGLAFYQQSGFVPVDVNISEACSRTLDFAYADAAAAAAGVHLGHADDSWQLEARSRLAVKAVFDKKARLMGRRTRQGAFQDKPGTTWGHCFTEGSAWHHSFPPFNLTLLAELHGGTSELQSRLWDVLAKPSTFEVGSYKVEIHEMREMRMLGMGQYAHNNQPVHHLLYLFSMLGDHNSTAQLVRQVLSRAYSVDGFVGDEDNGEMGAWYVLSALGLYAPATGVTDEYVLGAVPLFPQVLLRTLDVSIEAPSAPEESPPVLQVLWGSRPLPAAAVRYEALRKGGVLRWVSPGNMRAGVAISRLRRSLHEAMRRVKPPAEAPRTPPGADAPAAAAAARGGAFAPPAVAVAAAAALALLCACGTVVRRAGLVGDPVAHAD